MTGRTIREVVQQRAQAFGSLNTMTPMEQVTHMALHTEAVRSLGLDSQRAREIQEVFAHPTPEQAARLAHLQALDLLPTLMVYRAPEIMPQPPEEYSSAFRYPKLAFYFLRLLEHVARQRSDPYESIFSVSENLHQFLDRVDRYVRGEIPYWELLPWILGFQDVRVLMAAYVALTPFFPLEAMPGFLFPDEELLTSMVHRHLWDNFPSSSFLMATFNTTPVTAYDRHVLRAYTNYLYLRSPYFRTRVPVAFLFVTPDRYPDLYRSLRPLLPDAPVPEGLSTDDLGILLLRLTPLKGKSLSLLQWWEEQDRDETISVAVMPTAVDVKVLPVSLTLPAQISTR